MIRSKRINVPERFSLRHVRDDDHEFLVSLHNDPDVLHNLTNPTPITMQQHLSWWNQIKQNNKQIRLIFECDGVPIGFTKFYDIDTTNQNCVLGADIHKQYRGNGYAKFMWTLMLQKCFDELNLQRVSLTTAEYNTKAISIYTRLGFREEGKFEHSLLRNDQFFDQLLMRMLKSEWDSMEKS